MIDAEDTEYTNEPICPHCGQMSYGVDLLTDEDDAVCGRCGESFHCTRNVNITYTTRRIEGDGQ